jgi:hypothetical protein
MYSLQASVENSKRRLPSNAGMVSLRLLQLYSGQGICQLWQLMEYSPQDGGDFGAVI